jgi:hypothetical protein
MGEGLAGGDDLAAVQAVGTGAGAQHVDPVEGGLGGDRADRPEDELGHIGETVSAFLPVRVFSPAGYSDVSWLAPTKANLAMLELAIPAGFRQVAPAAAPECSLPFRRG